MNLLQYDLERRDRLVWLRCIPFEATRVLCGVKMDSPGCIRQVSLIRELHRATCRTFAILLKIKRSES